ncbi:hypothetical protein D3C73_1449050 [compost metagenome]
MMVSFSRSCCEAGCAIGAMTTAAGAPFSSIWPSGTGFSTADSCMAISCALAWAGSTRKEKTGFVSSILLDILRTPSMVLTLVMT